MNHAHRNENSTFSLGSTVIALLPVLLAGVLGVLAPRQPLPPSLHVAAAQTGLHAVKLDTSEDVERLFAALDYRWPPADDSGELPRIAVETLPADFASLSVPERKALFFRILAPLVAAENRKLREQREYLERVFAQHENLPEDIAFTVKTMAERYKVSGDPDDARVRELLLRRVDTVPVALALAQAANESGWGTSRFAREANNLFGMWTWDRDSGIAPLRRTANARHFVRVFGNLRGAVENYLHTINVGGAYSELRKLREQQRRRGDELSAWELAAGLSRYSERGEAYVAEIRSIIRFNRLHELPPLQLEHET